MIEDVGDEIIFDVFNFIGFVDMIIVKRFGKGKDIVVRISSNYFYVFIVFF